MLTAKQNMIECMKPGGKPDRFVNQYEAMSLQINPFFMASPSPQKGELEVVNAWGITNSWPENVPGMFPVHTPDKICVKDIENWKDYVHAPSLDFPQEMWDACIAMFEDFLLEPYKEIYGYYKSHGVEYIVHHSDSYAATLVPDMIEMGIDVYQGCMETNHVPELIKKYGDKISFMGVIENAFVDFEDWTDENCEAVVRRVCDECGMHSLLKPPCQR